MRDAWLNILGSGGSEWVDIDYWRVRLWARQGSDGGSMEMKDEDKA